MLYLHRKTDRFLQRTSVDPDLVGGGVCLRGVGNDGLPPQSPRPCTLPLDYSFSSDIAGHCSVYLSGVSGPVDFQLFNGISCLAVP
jgi:hypothetical protein